LSVVSYALSVGKKSIKPNHTEARIHKTNTNMSTATTTTTTPTNMWSLIPLNNLISTEEQEDLRKEKIKPEFKSLKEEDFKNPEAFMKKVLEEVDKKEVDDLKTVGKKRKSSSRNSLSPFIDYFRYVDQDAVWGLYNQVTPEIDMDIRCQIEMALEEAGYEDTKDAIFLFALGVVFFLKTHGHLNWE